MGDRLRVLNAPAVRNERFDRQIPLIGNAGQAALAAIRVAVVGAGGTGSQVLLSLAYLGSGTCLCLMTTRSHPSTSTGW